VQEKKKRGVPIDDPGDVDSDMMQVQMPQMPQCFEKEDSVL
jgi:hypothetical protein